MADKRANRVISIGQEILGKKSVAQQHIIVAVLAKIIEQQECEHQLVLEDGCSIYNDSDLEEFMMYAGFDYPDAYRLKAYVKCILDNNIT